LVFDEEWPWWSQPPINEFPSLLAGSFVFDGHDPPLAGVRQIAIFTSGLLLDLVVWSPAGRPSDMEDWDLASGNGEWHFEAVYEDGRTCRSCDHRGTDGGTPPSAALSWLESGGTDVGRHEVWFLYPLPVQGDLSLYVRRAGAVDPGRIVLSGDQVRSCARSVLRVW
jgi:hypothetical protein